MGTGDLSGKSDEMLGGYLRWTSIPSSRSSNIHNCFMLQKVGEVSAVYWATWLLCRFYLFILNTCTCLPSQVSNEIIKRCSTKISLDDIFEGRIKTSMLGLQESIECCESWKHTYSKVRYLLTAAIEI